MSQKSNMEENSSVEDYKAELKSIIENLSNFKLLGAQDRAAIKRKWKHILSSLPLSSVEKEFFIAILPITEAAVTSIIETLATKMGDEIFDKKTINNLATDLLTLLDCVEICFDPFETQPQILLDHVYTLPTTALSISQKLLLLYQDGEKCDKFENVSDSLKDLFNRATALTKNFISLWNKVQVFTSLADHVKEIVTVCTVLTNICRVFESISGKYPVALWKINISTMNKYCDAIRDEFDVAVTVRLLCSHVESRLSNLKLTCSSREVTDQQAVIRQDIQQCGFNIKIIIRLLENFKCYLGDCFEALLQLILSLQENSSSTSIPEPLKNEFERHVTLGIEPLVSILMCENQFISLISLKRYMDGDSRHSPYAWCLFYITLLENMNKLPEQLQNILLPIENCYVSSGLIVNNLLQDCFDVFSKCFVEIGLPSLLPGVMCQGKPRKLISFYDYCCIKLSSFIVGISSQQFLLLESVLVVNLLSDDVWKSILASDLWVFLGRLESSELCFMHCCLLADLTSQVQPEFHVCKRLGITLKRLFNILADNHKLLFFRKYHPTRIPQLWNYIGFKSLPSGTTSNIRQDLRRIRVELVDKVKDSLENNSSSLTDLSILVSLLTKLAVVSTSDDKCELVKLCIKLWHVLPVEMVTSDEIALMFVYRLIKWSCSLLDVFPNNCLLEILATLVLLQNDCGSDVVRYGILEFLRAVGLKTISTTKEQNQIFKFVSTLLSKCLQESHPILLYMGIEVFANFSQTTPHEAIIVQSLHRQPQLQDIIRKFLRKMPFIPALETKSDVKTMLLAQKNIIQSDMV